MILTVTLNSCVHEFITYEDARPEEPVVRPVATHWSSGGKGFNAARVIQRLGGEALAVGTAGGLHGEILRRCLAAEGVPSELVPVAAETRVSHCLFETRERRFRELLEPGVDAAPEEARALAGTVLARLESACFLTLNGSSPGPVLHPLFRQFVAAARARGLPVLVDSHGEPGALALDAVPNWIRCNREELHGTFGVAPEEAVEDWWREQDPGLEGLLVSDGARAVHLLGREERWRAVPPPVEEVNPVGSGDAMTGAFALALSRGLSLREALIQGVAAGSANAERLAVCELDRGRWTELLSAVQVDAV